MTIQHYTFVTVTNTEDPEVGGWFSYVNGEQELGDKAWRGWGETPFVAIKTLMEVLIEQELQNDSDFDISNNNLDTPNSF